MNHVMPPYEMVESIWSRGMGYGYSKLEVAPFYSVKLAQHLFHRD